ncbi:MAG: pseudouridine synthase [Bacteroidales bacterium]
MAEHSGKPTRPAGGKGPGKRGDGPQKRNDGPRKDGSGPRKDGGPRKEGGFRKDGTGPRREGGPRKDDRGPRREGSFRKEGAGSRREGSFRKDDNRTRRRPEEGDGPATDRKPKTDRKPANRDTGAAIRLNKYIASAGICSRRDADKLITAGLVSVNGNVVTELGTKVMPGDDVRYNGERLKDERKVYVLLNKPKDYVTTTDDPKERKTVMLLVKQACKERIYPVGRLDRNTTGVLLISNDGDLAKRLTHPAYNKKKIYHVFLDKPLTSNDMKTLAEGVTLEDGEIRADAISYVHPDNKREIGLEIHSGRNRIVRRMFEALEYKVTKLDRVYFAGLTKKNLSRGQWRFLTDKEIRMLKTDAYE